MISNNILSTFASILESFLIIFYNDYVIRDLHAFLRNFLFEQMTWFLSISEKLLEMSSEIVMSHVCG